jgi:hypothetical protein
MTVTCPEAHKVRRAVHAYMTVLPALNTIGMRDGSEATFGKGYNVLPIWKDQMDARWPGDDGQERTLQ